MTDETLNGGEMSHHDHHGDHHPHGPRRRRSPLARGVFLLVFAIVIAAIAFTGETLGHHRSSSASGTITVTGTGTVTGSPNTMSFQIGVTSVAASAAAALDENNTKMKAVEASLLAHGIKKKNLQTSNLDVYDNTNSSGAITGYTAQDDLNVTTHDIARSGAVLDAAAHVAGNQIQLSGVTFSISNQSSLLAKARAKAMANARTEATQIAKGGHTTVTSIVRVTDQENNSGGGIVEPFSEALSGTKAVAVPVQAGTQTVTDTVTVVYGLSS